MAISPYSSPSYRGSASQKHDRQVDHFRVNSKNTFDVSNLGALQNGYTPEFARSFQDEAECSLTRDSALLERVSTPSKAFAGVGDQESSKEENPDNGPAQLSLQQQIEEELFTFIRELEGTYFADQSKEAAGSHQKCTSTRSGSLESSGEQHNQQRQRDSHHELHSTTDLEDLGSLGQATQAQSTDQRRQQERGVAFGVTTSAQLSGDLHQTAVQEARWWNIMQQSQRDYVDNLMESEKRGSSSDQPFGGVHTEAPLRTVTADTRELETDDADDGEVTSVVMSCIRQLERLRPDQALRVLDSVSHLFEENGYYDAERWHSFPDPRFPGLTPQYVSPQVSTQAPRMMYGALPTPAELERHEFARWSEATPITAPRNENSNYSALDSSQSRERQGWSPPFSALPSGTSGSRPTTAGTSVAGASTMSPGSPLQRFQPGSVHQLPNLVGGSSQASLSQSRIMEERAKTKAGLPSVSVFLSRESAESMANGKRSATPALSELGTTTSFNESRSGTPASSAATSATSANARWMAGEDAECRGGGQKTASIAKPTWYGSLCEADANNLLRRYGSIVLCPGFCTGFGKVTDAENRAIIPGATQGFKVSVKRFERYRQKAQDPKYAWWSEAVQTKELDESLKFITVGDVIQGLDMRRWDDYRRAYKLHAARRASKSKSPRCGKKRLSEEGANTCDSDGQASTPIKRIKVALEPAVGSSEESAKKEPKEEIIEIASPDSELEGSPAGAKGIEGRDEE